MAFVHVEHGRCHTDRVQGAQPADAQQQLLPQASLTIAAVERCGDVAQLGRVFVDVRVEQVERYASNLCTPDRGVYLCPRHRHLDAQLGPVRAELFVDRHVRPVVGRVELLLPTIDVERLAEVAVAIEQTDTHQRQAKIGCRFEVIAGQDAQPARVDRERRVEPELEREVGDAQIGDPGVGLLEPPGSRLVGAEHAMHATQLRQERLVACGGIERCLWHLGERHHRVAS